MPRLWECIDDIVYELVDSDLLIKKGNKYFCPFCEDPKTSKSPSFSISSEKKIAKCFSCDRAFVGEKGLLRFYAQTKGISLEEAVKELKGLGIDIHYEAPFMELLMEYWKDALFEDTPPAKLARTRLGIRGIDINSEILTDVPVGMYKALPDKEFNQIVPQKYRKELKKVLNSIDGIATVHGYLNGAGEIKAIKFIPFDREFRTLKDKIRVFAPEGLDNLYHGIPGVFEEYDEILVVEGEFDFLTMATKTGWSNIIAFGGTAGLGSKALLPRKKYIIVPDRFGDKKGEEVALKYIEALGDTEIEVVNWSLYGEEVLEDPAEMFRSEPDKYASLVYSLKVPAHKFVWEQIKERMEEKNATGVIKAIKSLKLSIPPMLSMKLFELVQEEYKEINSSVFFRAFRPVGGELNVDLVYEILSKEFQIIYIDDTDKEEKVYLRYIPKNSIDPVVYTNKDKLYSALTNIVGMSFFDYLLEKLPIPESFFYKKDGTPKREREILSELRPLVFLAFDRMKGEASAKGLRGKKTILRGGVYWLDEGVAVIISGKKAFMIDKDLKVKKIEEYILFDGKYVILPSDSFGDWLPEDFDFDRINEVNPKRVYEKTLKYLKAVIKFPKDYHFQYNLLALLPFYAVIFDAFRDRVLWVMFNGESGAAKTTTEKLYVSTQETSGLYKLVLPSVFYSSYTPAALRQRLDGIRALVGLDEAEPEVLDRVMDEFRSMISADSITIRGTREQKAIEQENRFCALLSSIALPTRPQNLNRLLVFRFFKYDNVPTPTYTLRTSGMGYEFQKELAYDIFAAGLKVIHKVKELRLKAEDELREIVPTVSPRDAEAYAVILTVAKLLGVDISHELKVFAEMMNKIRKVPGAKEIIYHELLNMQIHVEGKGIMALSEICFNIEEDSDLLPRLEKRGFVYDEGKLRVPILERLQNFTYNIATMSSYLANDEMVRIDGRTLIIDIKAIKKKFKKNEITYKGSSF